MEIFEENLVDNRYYKNVINQNKIIKENRVLKLMIGLQKMKRYCPNCNWLDDGKIECEAGMIVQVDGLFYYVELADQDEASAHMILCRDLKNGYLTYVKTDNIESVYRISWERT